MYHNVDSISTMHLQVVLQVVVVEVDIHAWDVLLTQDLLVVNSRLVELGSNVFELDEKDACADDDSIAVWIPHDAGVSQAEAGHVHK